jgi:molybdenum cofactor cytidylyltransferase
VSVPTDTDDGLKVAVVLAAGASRRMGAVGSKLDLDLGGRTVLERSVSAYLGAAFDEVFLVVDEGATHRLPDDRRLRVLVNRRSREGLATSLRLALEALPDGTALVAVGLGDMPFVRRDTLARLIEAFSKRPESIVYPVHRGERGHPVLWPASFVPELLKVSGDRGARSIVERFADRTFPVMVDDPGVCLDIDSPDDYARLKTRFDI